MACRASASALSCWLSGSASRQVAYWLCSSVSTATASRQRRARRSLPLRRRGAVGRATRADHRRPGRVCGAVAGLAASVMAVSPMGLRGMRSTANRYVTKRLWPLGQVPPGSGAILEAPAVVAGLDDVAMMRQPVEQGGGHLRIAEDAGPFAEGEIGGDNDGGALIETADEMEQQLPAGLGRYPSSSRTTKSRRVRSSLSGATHALGARLHPQSAAGIAELVRLTNCYYSNLIEGHSTTPREIERALQDRLDA